MRACFLRQAKESQNIVIKIGKTVILKRDCGFAGRCETGRPVTDSLLPTLFC